MLRDWGYTLCLIFCIRNLLGSKFSAIASLLRMPACRTPDFEVTEFSESVLTYNCNLSFISVIYAVQLLLTVGRSQSSDPCRYRYGRLLS